jgi:hypothetical protein
VKVTLRHHFDFGDASEALRGDLVQPGSWDSIRETEGPFYLPQTRTEWETAVVTSENRSRADAVARVADELGARRVVSHGVGVGALELCLVLTAPQLELTCTDYSPRTVERLERLFPEARVLQHDLRSDAPLDADLHVMHRIDTELDRDEWRRVFSGLASPIVFVPGLILGVSSFGRELFRRLARRRLTKAGYLRNESALRDLWSGSFVSEPLRVGGERGFLLRPRQGAVG